VTSEASCERLLAKKKKGDKKSTILIRVDVDALTRDGSLRLHIDQRGLIIACAHARMRMAGEDRRDRPTSRRPINYRGNQYATCLSNSKSPVHLSVGGIVCRGSARDKPLIIKKIDSAAAPPPSFHGGVREKGKIHRACKRAEHWT